MAANLSLPVTAKELQRHAQAADGRPFPEVACGAYLTGGREAFVWLCESALARITPGGSETTPRAEA